MYDTDACAWFLTITEAASLPSKALHRGDAVTAEHGVALAYALFPPIDQGDDAQ
jgi:hypothetical protein